MSGAATFIKRRERMRSDALVYRLNPPIELGNGGTSEYVVVSAVEVAFSGPETYIFASDEDGVIYDWMELHGSFRGALDHAWALRGAGYEIVGDPS